MQRMKLRRVACAIVTLALARAVSAAPAPGPEGPAGEAVPLRVLAARHHLQYVEEPLSGRVLLLGGAQRVVAVNGMSGVLVNDRYLPLPERVRLLDGEYRLPAAGLGAIEAALGASRPPTVRPPEAPRTRVPLRRIVLDPGHGGGDPGTHGSSGIQEKTINLDVARRLRELLVEEGLTVVMTRDGDRALSTQHKENLRLRSELAHTSGAELFLSIHSNSNPQSSLRGFEVYYGRDEYRAERVADAAKTTPVPLEVLGVEARPSPSVAPVLWDALYDEYYRESRELAEAVRRGLARTGIPDRGLHAAGFYVLRWTHCPSILVEMDYVTNPAGQATLSNPDRRQAIARALADGILAFKRDFDAADRFNR
ncbi:MAG: N-acetylmuramoyl-L-alanine amidase [Planctomycetes bacterium]|nr:N-acetylmuramoyl-L-alanine amidase [Planctomycetota bacterium]